VTERQVAGAGPIAVIEGPRGKAEIFESVSAEVQALIYEVKFNDVSQSFNNLGEAYITAGELSGSQT
jgi:hypothetical protein